MPVRKQPPPPPTTTGPSPLLTRPDLPDQTSPLHAAGPLLFMYVSTSRAAALARAPPDSTPNCCCVSAPSRPQTVQVSLAFHPHLLLTAVTEPLGRHALRGSLRFRPSLFRASHGVCNASSYAPSSCPSSALVASLLSELERVPECQMLEHLFLCSFLSTLVHAASLRIRSTLLRTAPPGVCHLVLSVSARR